jgi:hypothetical protein
MTYFFVHHTGKVYRRDLLTNLLSELLIQRQSNQLVAQSTLVVAMTPLGTGKILKDREYRREDLSQDEMVMLALQAESV